MKTSQNTIKNLICPVMILMLLTVESLYGQQLSQTLQPNQPIERTIKGGEGHIYQFNVKKGEYVHIEVEQKNVDVVVSLFAPNGDLVVEMDGRDGRLWREAVSALAREKGGVFRVEIKAYGNAKLPGSYQIKLDELRQFQAKDDKRLKAEQHFITGTILNKKGFSEIETASKEFEAALKLWREIGEREWEGITLIYLGETYINLSKSEQAVISCEQAAAVFQETGDKAGQAKAAICTGLFYANLNPGERARIFYEQALNIRRKIGDKRGEGNVLNNLANLYFKLAEYEKAREFYERELAIHREIKNPVGESYALYNLGNVYRDLNQPEKAIEYFEQALKLHREVQNKRDTADTLLNLTSLFEDLGKYEKAKDYYEQALALSREVKERQSEMEILNDLGRVHYILRQYEKSKDYYQKALTISQKIKNRFGENNSVLGLGNIANDLGEFNKAKDYYDQSLKMSRENKNRGIEGITLNNLGNLYLRSNQNDKAKDYYEQALIANREIKNRADESLTLGNIGSLYYNLGQFSTAEDYYRQSLTIYREIKNRTAEAGVIRSLAALYKNLEQSDKAKDYYEQALIIRRELADRTGEADILVDLGLLFEDLKQFDKAKDYYEQALVIRRELKDRIAEASTLNDLGLVYHYLNQQEKAREYYEQALRIYQESNAKFGQAVALSNIADTYKKAKDNLKALDYYEKSWTLYREMGNYEVEANLRNITGDIYKSLEKMPDALNNYNAALKIFIEIKNRDSEANTLSKIADVYEDLDNEFEALKYYTDALAIYRQLGIRYNEALMLHRIGNRNLMLGEKQKALDAYNEALKIYESLGEKNEAANALSGIGNVYQMMILPEKALGYFEKALKIYQELKDKEDEAVTLMVLSGIYSTLGEKEKAQAYVNQASAIFQNSAKEYADILNSMLAAGISDDEDEALEKLKQSFSKFDKQLSRLNNEETEKYLVRMLMVGLFYILSEDNEKAIEYFNRVLELSRSEKIKQGEAFMLYLIGFCKAEKEPLAAVKDFKEAADILRSIGGNKLFEAVITMSIAVAYGEIYENDKKPEYLAEAVNYLNQALILSREGKDKTLEAALSLILMQLWDEEKQPQLAIFYGKQSVNIFQSLRAELKDLDKKLQDSYLQKVSETYQKLAEILIAQGRIAEAEQVLAMLKEQEFFEYLRRDDKVARELLATLSLTPAEQEAFRRFDELADNLTKIGRELGELQRELTELLTKNPKYQVEKFPKKARLDKLESQLADANKVFNTFLDTLKIKFGQTDERVAKIDSGTQTLLKALSQPRTAIISTIASEDRLNLIVTTQDSQRAHIVNIKAADLNKLVFEFRDAVKNPSVDPRPPGKKLYDVLFPADLEKDLEGIKADTIIWSLDGTLRYAPIAALWDGKKYLAERYANAIITLASRDKLNNPQTNRDNWTVLGAGVSKQFEDFSALDSVPGELCSIVNDVQSKTYCASLMAEKKGAIDGRILTDEKFTLMDFKANLGRFPIVHIASHFSLNAGNESNSYLLLGAGKTSAERKLSLARIREEFSTKFVGVELLTLSACNTAMTAGNKSNGLEVEGFGALAQKQGAKSVLATLWAVADPSTKDLMTEFYQILKSDFRISKVQALRQAQLKLLKGNYKVGEIPFWRRGSEIINLGGENKTLPAFNKDPNAPFAHPYYWSPFILFGNWR